MGALAASAVLFILLNVFLIHKEHFGLKLIPKQTVQVER